MTNHIIDVLKLKHPVIARFHNLPEHHVLMRVVATDVKRPFACGELLPVNFGAHDESHVILLRRNCCEPFTPFLSFLYVSMFFYSVERVWTWREQLLSLSILIPKVQRADDRVTVRSVLPLRRTVPGSEALTLLVAGL
jgi:hypothetical protein